MFIVGLGTAAPAQRYTQRQCWNALQSSRQFNDLSPRSRAVLRKVLTGNNGIETRHLAFDDLAEAFELTPDALHQRFIRNAPHLAAEAAQRALEDAQTQPDQIDAVIISTCTGYLCPGLTSYVGERLGLRADAINLDLVGQGCGAALPNLRAAEALLAANRCGRVLSICVEVCSAAFYLDDDIGVLISACLFGDGAGAAVLSNEPFTRLTVICFASNNVRECCATFSRRRCPPLRPRMLKVFSRARWLKRALRGRKSPGGCCTRADAMCWRP